MTQYPHPVSEGESLGRYIPSRSYYRPSDNSVKHSAFQPASDNELSVYRIDGLQEDEIFAIGRDYVTAPQGKTLLGYAYIFAKHFLALQLTIEATALPHPRHANVKGWPEKQASLAKAHILASHAKLKLVA